MGPRGDSIKFIYPIANSPDVRLETKLMSDDTQIDRLFIIFIGFCEKYIKTNATFLASGAAAYITVHTLIVDGGQTEAF